MALLNGCCDLSVNAVDERWLAQQDAWGSKELEKLGRELEEMKEEYSRE